MIKPIVFAGGSWDGEVAWMHYDPDSQWFGYAERSSRALPNVVEVFRDSGEETPITQVIKLREGRTREKIHQARVFHLEEERAI